MRRTVSACRVRLAPTMRSTSFARSISSSPMEVATWNFSGCSVRSGDSVRVCSSKSSRRTTDEPLGARSTFTRKPNRSSSRRMSWVLVSSRSSLKSRRSASACSSSSGK